MHTARLLINRYFSQITMFAAAGAVLIGLAPGASAALMTFAQFHEDPPGPNSNLFSYFDNGSNPGGQQVVGDAQFVTDMGGVKGAAIPVVFNFLAAVGPLPPDLSGNQAATVSMSSSTTNPVVTGFGGTVGQQIFDGSGSFTDIIQILRETPAAEGNGSRTNLLTVTFTGQLSGTVGSPTPQFSGSSALGFTVNYTSDFLNFGGVGTRDFSLTFSSWTSNGGGGLSIDALTNYFNSATAAGAGTFDADLPRTPEPATLTLGAIGAAGLAVVAARRKRRAASSKMGGVAR